MQVGLLGCNRLVKETPKLSIVAMYYIPSGTRGGFWILFILSNASFSSFDYSLSPGCEVRALLSLIIALPAVFFFQKGTVAL